MSKIKSMLSTATLILVAFVATFAQSSKGILVGTITDPSGAVIAGATVKATNTATNVTRDTVSGTEGNFRLDAVDPGAYKIEITVSGFKTLAVDNVLVSAGQTTSNNLKLEVGDTGVIVDVVNENPVALQTQDGSRTNTLDSKQIRALPVVGVNPVNLVFTLPGVSVPSAQAGGFVQGPEFAINGLRPRSNNQLIDGTDNNDNSITGQFTSSDLVDGYQEVSILGANNSAEYGRGGGAVVNVITKSGSNQFHGSVYDVINTSALSSLSNGQKNNLSSGVGDEIGLKSVPVETRNRPGASFGGPIIKDKLFFFGTYQSHLFRSGTNATAVVPTADGYAKLRSLFPQGKSPNLDRYLAIVGDLRGNSSITPVDLGDDRGNVNFGSATLNGLSAGIDEYQFLTRVDWTPTSTDSFTFRYLFDDQTFSNQIPSAFKGYGVDNKGRTQNFYFNHTHTFSPSLTNEFRASVGRFRTSFDPQDKATLEGPVFAFASEGIDIDSVGLDATFPQGRIFNNYQYQDTITYVVGNHTIRAGADVLRQLAKQFVPFNNRGNLTFSDSTDFSAFGNFVDGFSGTQGVFASKVFGSPVTFPNAFQQAYFINDSWRVKSNLTLNLGIRYENYGTPANVLRFPAFAGFNIPIDTVAKQKRDDNNWAPRFSFAYTPRFGKWLFGEDKTVFRGGYAVSYDLYFNNILSNTAAASPNVFGVTTLGSDAENDRGFGNAGVNSLPTTGTINPKAGITTIDPNLVNPLIQVWNLSVQRELPGNFIVDVAYVGSRGMRLFQNQQLNPGGVFRKNDKGVPVNTRVFLDRGPITSRTNSGDSIYHALQTRVERGFKNGVFVRLAYTYSKSIDNVSEVFLTSGGSSLQSNPFDGRADRGPSAFDARHRTALSYVWDIPAPKTGIWGQVAGGWTVSGTYSLQSGALESPYVGGLDLNRDLNNFNDRPANGNLNAPANSVAIVNFDKDGKFNGYRTPSGSPIDLANARYIVDPNIRTSIAGRNTLQAKRVNLMDFSVNKAFKLPFEGHKLEFRLELFNALNHANYTWANDDVDLGDRSTGDVRSKFFNNVRLNDGGNRTGRFQVRYSF